MSIPKCYDFENYDNYPTESNPTSNSQMQEYMRNQNALVKQLASMMWQPQTQYTAGQFVFSSALPSGAFAVCVTAGRTGTTEPTWSAIGSNTSDSGVTWNVRKLSPDLNFLPINGGTLTGNQITITPSGSDYKSAIFNVAGNDGCLKIQNGYAWDFGGSIELYGKDTARTEYKGTFNLFAHDGTNSKSLTGYPNGDLKWGTDNIVVSMQGKKIFRLENNTSDSWIPVFANDYIDYITKEQLLGNRGVVLPNGVCATARGTVAKVVTVEGDFNLTVGQMILVKFSDGNSARAITLNVNNSGAKPIKAYNGVGHLYTVSGSRTSDIEFDTTAKEYMTFVYDGTNWVIVGGSTYFYDSYNNGDGA